MRARFWLFGALMVLGGGVSTSGCSCGSGTSNSPPPGGGEDAAGAPDGGDAGATTDAGGSNDSGAHACANGKTPTHLPSGYSEVASSAVDPNFGIGASMALDENDDPLIAYLAVPASVESGAAPGDCSPSTTTAGCAGVYFTRWDRCAGAFTTPVLVDPNVNFTGTNPGVQLLSLAYDPTTKEIGIAYSKTFPTDPNWADTFGGIMLATWKSGAPGFVVQQVSDNRRWENTDVSSSDVPSLAMANGHIYIAFANSFLPYGCNTQNNVCLRLLSSTEGPPPAGTGNPEQDDAGNPLADDAGLGDTPPAHYFSYAYVPGEGDDGGQADPWTVSLSLGVDSSGRPAIAYYQVSGNNIPELVFWRSDMTTSVSVLAGSIQNDYVNTNLAFEGTAPRIAGLFSPDSTDTGSITYISSTDGVTWNAPENLVLSGGAGTYSTLATDGNGNEAIATYYNGSPSAAAAAEGCGQSPFLATSSNSGTAWAGCDVAGPSVRLNSAMRGAFGASRIAGTFTLVGANVQNGATLLDGGSGYSVIYYQAP